MRSSPAKAYHPRWGWLCMFLGLYPIAFALKFFPTGDTTGYAPMWIIFLCGLAFVVAGTVILVKRHSRINTLLVTSILLILGAMGVWVTLFADGEWFVGGFTALNEDQNIVLARWMFGIGSFVSFMMTGYCIQQFLLSLIHPSAIQSHPAESKASSRPANPLPVSPRPVSPRSKNLRPENPRPVSSRPESPRPVSPSSENPGKQHRRVRPNLLKQLLYPKRSNRRRYVRHTSKPKRPSKPFQADRRHPNRQSPSSSQRR